MAPPIDLVRRAEARRLRALGHSIREIVALTGAPSSDTIRRWVADVELTPEQEERLEARWTGSRLKPRTDPRELRARALRAEGASVKQIARELGAAQSAVSRWVRTVPLSPAERQGLEVRRAERQRETKMRHREEEGGYGPTMSLFRRRALPAGVPADLAAVIEEVLRAEFIEAAGALAVARAIVQFRLVPITPGADELCEALLERGRRGRRLGPVLRHLLAGGFLSEPAVNETTAREIVRLAHAAGRAGGRDEARALALQAVGLLRREKLTLTTRARAAFCAEAREAMRRHQRRSS